MIASLLCCHQVGAMRLTFETKFGVHPKICGVATPRVRRDSARIIYQVLNSSASSYTLCEVDSSSDDVVILYWIMIDTHIVPDR